MINFNEYKNELSGSYIFIRADRKVGCWQFHRRFLLKEIVMIYTLVFSKGILLHREIDHFTDTHPIFRETVDLIRPLGRYSGIMVDMYYDYLLASDFERYSNGQSSRQILTQFLPLGFAIL